MSQDLTATLPDGHSSPRRLAAWGLIACTLAIGLQALLRQQPVGSALYSPVQPLFASGLPPAVLTWLVFTRRPRGWAAATLVGLLCLLWVLGPLTVDSMYLTHGGYRGPRGVWDAPVIGPAWDMLIALFGWGLFLVVPMLPISVLVGIWTIFRAPAADRVPVLAMALSVVTLCLQMINWGGFIWD